MINSRRKETITTEVFMFYDIIHKHTNENNIEDDIWFFNGYVLNHLKKIHFIGHDYTNDSSYNFSLSFEDFGILENSKVISCIFNYDKEELEIKYMEAK